MKINKFKSELFFKTSKPVNVLEIFPTALSNFD
jgi:hypothetical protein